jgi:hypothetical protein
MTKTIGPDAIELVAECAEHGAELLRRETRDSHVHEDVRIDGWTREGPTTFEPMERDHLGTHEGPTARDRVRELENGSPDLLLPG